MRCLDSRTLASQARGTRVRRQSASAQQARCGGCDRWIDVVDGRLAEHGDRQPCPLCGDRSPRHHPTDHPAPCQPTGPLGDPQLPGEARCVGGHGPLRGHGPLLDGAGTCKPGTPIWRVPQGDRDWRWADAGGCTVVDLAPATLRDDPAMWWAGLVEADPGTYSVLSAATSSHQASWLHTHRPDGTEPPAGIDVPVCCSQPMHLVPAGWRCRGSGLVFSFQGDSDA